MRTEKQIQTSRINGSRSRGPVTPQGKRNRAGIRARHRLLAEYLDEHQPRTATEVSLIETMAVSRWRLLRVWGAQKTAPDRDMALQDANVGPRARARRLRPARFA